ncbi:MAG TPA: adenine deaminase [Desulfobacteria bacterium]|nr:adenine deaminase [Desulfobacteria bacterium]
MTQKNSIDLASGNEKTNLVLKNCRIVDVEYGIIFDSDIGITADRIVKIQAGLTGTQTVDVAGKFVAPGLVEPHVHYESSKLPLSAFARLIMAHGTTTVVNDPHEIANVLGIRGVRETLREARLQPISVYTTVPSCVPASPFETSGATLGVKEVEELLREVGVIALGELMNFPGVINDDPVVMGKIAAAKRLGKIIEGHCPLLSGEALKKYYGAGINSDHEVTEGWELAEKLKLGMTVYIRFGSQAKDLENLVGYILDKNIPTDNLAFCTDDRHISDLVTHGHLDYTVRMAVSLGLDPITALQMATINPCRHFRLDDRGVIEVGKRADLVVFDDLTRFVPRLVIAGGKIVAREGIATVPEVKYDYSFGLNSVHCPQFSAERFVLPCEGKRANVNVIKVLEGRLITDSVISEMDITEESLEVDITNDILKIAVTDRHTGMGGYSVGFVNGFGLKEGAIGSTVAHDSHNIIVVGTNDGKMAAAVNALREMGGGEVVVSKEGIIRLVLEYAGLMSLDEPAQVVKDMEKLEEAYRKLGGELTSPFMALSFLALPVIPALKITDKGLYEITERGIARKELIVEIT